MSQVRKLLNGNLIPKAEGGYKFKLDSQEYTVTDEQLKEIDDKIALLEPQHRRFLGNWTNAIKSGDSSGNRASNTVTMNMLSGVDGRDVDRLKKQKGSFWESFAPKDSYYAKEAINEALTITASVLSNTPMKQPEGSNKTKIEKSSIDLDFNEKDGKKYLSPTSEQNMSARKRVSDLLAHLQAGNNSTYDYSAYDTDAISAWLNGLEGDDKYKAGNDYFNNLWTAMGNSSYAYDPDVDDLLKMFGINYGLTASAGNVASADSAIGSGSIGSGTISPGASGTTGASTGNTKVGDIITVLDKDYKVTGFKDNGDPILEEVVDDVENNKNQAETEIETEQQEVNPNWNPEIIEYSGPMTGIGPKYGLTYTPVTRSLELMEIGTVTLPFDRWGRLTGRVKQRLMKDINGTLYSIGEDGIICLINSDYVKDILAGKQITYDNWHKNTKVFVRSRKQGGTISKSKADSFKSKFGNVVKGQDGLVTPEWEAYKKRNSLTANIPTITVTIDGKPQTIIQKPVGMRLESGLKNPSAYTISNNDGIRRTSSIVRSDEEPNEEPDEVGGYPMNIQDRSKHLIPLISLIRFGINAGLQKKYRDTAKKAIEAGRFNEQPAVLNTPRNDNPALDRALQQIQSERMAGVKPVTSDLIANNAILNQREAQLWDREQNIIGQRSQADWEAKKQALNIMNQNIVNQTTTANSNRARNAAINSALYNPELEFIQRRGQSIENLGLEIQNNIKQDRNIMLNHQRDLELQKETNILNNKLDAMFPGARKEYDLLSDDEKLNYTDYADFLRKKYPEKWNANVDTINRLQSAYTNNIRAWMYENGLNYSYPTFLTGRQSPIGYKKGGYLRGSTRYTMEPDERIWVDNNKATHAAISKLSENTIKLLLRALK